MRAYENYQSNAAEVPIMRKWFFRALILSLIFHATLFFWFKATKLERFSTTTERLVPRTFMVNRLVIDSKLLDAQENDSAPPQVKKESKEMPAVQLPTEQPQFEKMMKEVRATPDTVDSVKPIISEKPRVDASTVETMARLQENASKTMEHEIEAAHDQLLNNKISIASGPALKPADSTAERLPVGNSDAAAVAAAAGRLDQLLGNGLSGNDAPLQLPGGALFDFDKADVNPAAIKLLEKVATLIQKNPQATFTIEGYTDSFGSPEHNLDLSARRAEAVKTWLLQKLAASNIQFDPAHIQSKGFGGSHFRVEPQPVEGASQTVIDAEIARQQPNRRVELVFRLPVGN
jgi:outer membrane protein OmpA-like peptidoglycan-associated protein